MSLIHIKQLRNLPSAGPHSVILYDGTINLWSNQSNAALQLTTGTTTQRPTPLVGLIRFNTTLNRLEYVDNSLNWIQIQGGLQKVTLSFTQADLVGNFYTATHNLGDSYPLVTIYDNTNNIIYPTQVTSVNPNTTDIDLTGFTPISGTWRAVFVGAI
ncbi:MAG: hypothetical protein NZZ41_00775 [Candidatus Dojkabacteria bacterium]|nr:hypothetical protein [Candidatus Dojkabacteria bacterium]